MKERRFIELLGQIGTVKILKTINNSEKCKFTDLKTITSRSTLYQRLNQLTTLGLIKKIKHEKQREKHYEITEKGKKVVEIIDKLGNLFKKSE